MIDTKSLRILSDALRESIILGSRNAEPIRTLSYANWERTLEEELSLDTFCFGRNPLDRGLYVPDGSRVAQPRPK